MEIWKSGNCALLRENWWKSGKDWGKWILEKFSWKLHTCTVLLVLLVIAGIVKSDNRAFSNRKQWILYSKKWHSYYLKTNIIVYAI